MWRGDWRKDIWSTLDTQWDLIVIGGGITGAGILREATRAGLKALLVEADDFASGTSSRSSKLVHGGFRYLKNAQIRLTLESVRERERLLKEGRGLVSPLGFLAAGYRQDRFPGWLLGIGLIIYDLLALKWGHRHYDSDKLLELCPQLCEEGLQGGYRFFDAQTDDARLVLRVIREAVQEGGTALNYARATQLLKQRDGTVCGVVLGDRAGSSPNHTQTAEVQAGIVINATGAWADELRMQVGGRERLRKLRGSHLVFPYSRLPLLRAVSINHPQDQRFVFAFPWEGVTIVGTTDVDHRKPLRTDPQISPEEVDYLMQVVEKAFPGQELTIQDVQASFSGVRPVVGSGKQDPSKESREHVLWYEDGLLTVTGGKLTTFRLMAHDALKAASARNPQRLPRHTLPSRGERVLKKPGDLQFPSVLSGAERLRLLGRYGVETEELLEIAREQDYESICGTPSLWAELRWAAHAEGVVHLDDLLLRRVRIGLTLPHGGIPAMDRIRAVTQAELGWSDARWQQEVQDYTRLWEKCYDLER